ncbi:hypothetical protein ACFQ93_40485 [Streptomyces sp. NPDC056601]|uniref:hypothetical protein n=1 Tax=Streptomyces sp. NPDC056601 TaxID=3345875 RepID=UPI00368FE836
MTSHNSDRFDGFTQNAVEAEGPLADIARNPDAYARYLADLQRVLLEMKRNVETLQTHVRVHCRGQRVEGDKWGQAWLRAFPVEQSVRSVISDLESLAKGLEKSAHKHHAHAEGIRNVAKERKEKALEKSRKKNPLPQAVPVQPAQPPQAGQTPNMGYSGPTSLWGLSDRDSA